MKKNKRLWSREAAAWRLWRPALRAAARHPPPPPKPPDKPKEEQPRAYRLNLALFIVAMILAWVWFENHLRLYVTGTRIISGTLTLWGLWKLVQEGLGWGVQTKPATQRLLGRPGGTELLVFALLVLVALNLTTSSIYVEYLDPPGGTREVTVQVLSNGSVVVEPWTVRSYDRIAGRPFFLRWRTEPLVFEVTQPPGFASLTRDLGPGRGLYLRVPADFRQRSVAVLCFAPGVQTRNLLPKAGESAEFTYAVRMVRNGSGPPELVEDVRRGKLLCLGAPAGDLPGRFDRRNKETFHQVLFAQLRQGEIPSDVVEGWVREYETEPRYQGTAEFQPGDEVAVELLKGGVALKTQSVKLSRESVQTVSF
jgi:hypothetical protein